MSKRPNPNTTRAGDSCVLLVAYIEGYVDIARVGYRLGMPRPKGSRYGAADRQLDQTVNDLGPADGKFDAVTKAKGSRARSASARSASSGGAVVASMPDVPLPRYCAARTSAGAPCKKAPLFGSTLCRNHRGNTAPQRVNSSKRIELRKAAVALQQIGLDADALVDPRIVLLQAVSIAHQTLGVVAEMVRSLEEDDIQEIGSIPLPGESRGTRGARAEAFFHLLNVWTDRASKVSRLALQVGLEDRMVHLAEVQAAMLVESTRAAFLDAQIPVELQEGFLVALSARLRLVSTPRLVEAPRPGQVPSGDFPANLNAKSRLVSPATVVDGTGWDAGMTDGETKE